MFYRLCTIVLALCLIGLPGSGQAKSLSWDALMAAPYAPDRVLVKFRPGTAAVDRARAHERALGRPLAYFDSIDVQLMQVPRGAVPAALKIYSANPNVLYAEVDAYRMLVVPQEEEGALISGGAILDFFAEQWYLNNTGQEYHSLVVGLFGVDQLTHQGTEGADINAAEAWDLTLGLETTDMTVRHTPRVAVLDSGADCNTLELQGKCLEQVNFTGLSAGYEDDCPTSKPACDNLGHGTFVSSEIAANTNNNEGIAGIGWNTGLGIFKVCYQELVTDGWNLFTVGLCPVSNSIAAIENASQDQYGPSDALERSRYSIITMSYGSDQIDDNGNITPTTASSAECEAIQAAWDNGVLVVAAAGNNGNTERVYPAACANVIAVAASDHHDDRTAFTTFSWPSDPWVTLSAPGQTILGILPDAHCGLAPGVDSCVDWWDGTSMAAPLVAGGAALVWSYLFEQEDALITAAGGCEVNGQPCHHAVRDRLQNNAAQVGARGQSLTEWTRYGRLDVAAALVNDTVPELPPPPPSGYVPPSAEFGYSCDGFICSFNAAGSENSGWTFSWSLGDDTAPLGPDVTEHAYSSSGTYTVILVVSATNPEGAYVSSIATFDLTLNSPKKIQSGTVLSVDGGTGSGDGSDGGNCPQKKRDRGQC